MRMLGQGNDVLRFDHYESAVKIVKSQFEKRAEQNGREPPRLARLLASCSVL